MDGTHDGPSPAEEIVGAIRGALTDKVLPHTFEAEQALLGAILLNNQAFDRVAGFLKGEHFFDPINGRIYDACRELIEQGKTASPPTMAPFFKNDPALKDAGGARYLARLAGSAVTIVNAGDYGRAILETWMQRRCLARCVETVETIIYPDAAVDSERLLGTLSHDIEAIMEGSPQGGLRPASDGITKAVAAAETAQKQGRPSGHSTGLSDLDRRIGGLFPGAVVVIGGRPGMGKEQPVDQPVLTPEGWRAIGDIRPGDFVFGAHGSPVRVWAVHPQGIKPAYRVMFRDGTSTECGLEHLWSVASNGGRSRKRFSVRPLNELMAAGLCTPKSGNRVGAKWRIPVADPVAFAPANLPIEPYTLGVLIGDGSLVGRGLRFSNPDIDRDIRELASARLPRDIRLNENRSGACPYFDLRGAGRREFARAIRELGLNVHSGDKFIPSAYFVASVEQRLELLRGLMDTDGGCQGNRTSFYSTSRRLAGDVATLVRSLGGVAIIRTYERAEADKPTEYVVNVKMAACPFHTRRKAAAWRPQAPTRYMRSAEYSRDVEQVCISVESEDGLYLTNDYVVTHNSTCAATLALNVAKQGAAVGFFSQEMPDQEVGTVFLAALSGVSPDAMRAGQIDDRQWGAIVNAQHRLNALPIWIDQRPALRVADMRAQARRLSRQHKLGLIVVDYLQLCRPEGKHGNRVSEITEITAALKTMAKETGACVLALSQLSRALESRDDKRPTLSDLRECLPVEEWVDTPRGPVRLREQPEEIVSADIAGAHLRACSYIPKRENRTYRVCTHFGAFSATAKHLVLTGVGWKRVRDLVPGRDVVACPKFIPHANAGPQPHGRLLGWLLGNGGLSGTPSLIFRTELEAAVAAAVRPLGVRVNKRHTQKSANVIDAYLSNGIESGSLPNPLMQWIRGLGIEGCTASTKRIPERYLGSSNETHRDVLRGLWETDGTVTSGTAKFAVCSEILARQVKWLLHTIGVRASVSREENDHLGLWVVRCAHEDNVRLKGICDDERRFGRLAEPCRRYIDPTPAIFVELLSEVYSGSERIQCRTDGQVKQIPKQRLAAMLADCPVATINDSPFMAMENMGWAPVASVDLEDHAVRVCDLHVPETHCFLTNGLVVHNSGSIEQDADVVLFLYRSEYYLERSLNACDEQEHDKRAKLANALDRTRNRLDIIIAKQRMGGLGTVRAHYNASLARITDEARNDQRNDERNGSMELI